MSGRRTDRRIALGAIPSGTKQPSEAFKPNSEKLPKIASDPTSYFDRKAAWRIGRAQLADPYGWHSLSLKEISEIQSKLANFETMTWDEIFNKGRKRNHPIGVSELKCRDAQKWMARNMPDQPTLWTLRLSGPERVWGIFAEGAYQIVFWDPDHKIYPTTK